jgi:transposase-like protein
MSSEPESAATIVRTGTDGRLRYDPQQREALLDAFTSSGQSALAFARQHGVNYQTFISWLRKRRECGAPLPPDTSAFAEVLLDRADQPAASSELRLTLPCGTSVDVPSRAALPLVLELLQALRHPC